jgi:spermidine synthase
MPLINSVYTAWAGSGFFGMLLRGVIAGICLLPPTFLMGATLPAISRWVETTPRGVSGWASTAATSLARRRQLACGFI